MKFENILSVLTGLAIFLYGMEVMGNGFKHIAGSKLQDTLEKLTKKPFIAMLAGILVTALVQSSGATTSMLVSFVNAGIMKVAQTVFVIMGANIGTTVTGHLMALDVGLVAPFLAFFGVVFIMFFKKDRINALGEILLGLGFVFIGMDIMGGGLKPLQSSPFFLNLLLSMQNPIVGILVGFVFTTLVQSSSASLGIIQTLAKTGVVRIEDVMFFNLGQKMGSCTTAMLAALSFNRDAKRVSIINLIFNILGAAVFTVLYLLLPFDRFYSSLAPGNVVEQIALMHTIVSIVETAIFYPFSWILTKLTYMIIPDQGSEKKLQPQVEQNFKTETNASFNLFGINIEINNMLDIVEANIQKSIVALLEHHSVLEEIDRNEDTVNTINSGISQNLSLLMASNLNYQEAKQASQLFQINIDLERMSDHSLNIAESGDDMVKADRTFTDENYDQIHEISSLIFQSLDAINHIISFDDSQNYFSIIDDNEDKIDDLCYRYRNQQIERMKNETADMESSVVFTELLIDFERIGDHIVNLAEQLQDNFTD